MMNAQKGNRVRRWLRNNGRAIALLWGLFWTWFGLASGIQENLSFSAVILHAAFPGGFFLLSAALLFVRERAASLILLGEGVLVAIVYPLWAAVKFPPESLGRLLLFMFLTMALPPLLAGGLILAARGRRPS